MELTEQQANELQDILVETIIDYLYKNNISNCDEITFKVDGLKNSIKERQWIPTTDSAIEYWTDNRKLLYEIF